MRKTKKKSLPKSRLPIFLGILAILFVGYYTYRTVFRPQPIDINQVTRGSGTVTLTLTPANSTLAANTTRELTLSINAGTDHVSGAQVEITFDSTKCVTPVVSQGSFLTGTPLVPASVANGKISFTYIAPPASGGVTGSGTLATITTGPKNAACRLTFTTNTEVYVTESTTNALASASDAVINLPGASSTPTPTPSPSATPRVSPTANPRLSPTPSPTPSNNSWLNRYCTILKVTDPVACQYMASHVVKSDFIIKLKWCRNDKNNSLQDCVISYMQSHKD